MAKINSSLRNERRALLQVLAADIIWGLGFAMAQWTLFVWSPVISSVIRFALAFAVCLLFFGFKKQLYWKEIRRAMLPGILNSGVLLLQTAGLRYTEVTKVGFITTLYVVFVPLLERFFWKKRLTPWHWLWVFLALLGTLVISGASFASINRGDLLTLLCSVCAALHILSLSNLEADISPYRFNMWQCGWALLVSFVPWLVFERNEALFPALNLAEPRVVKALIGMGSLVFLSSILAFSIQAEAQRWLSPSVAGLLYLLECITGAIFAYFLVGERLPAWQWTGAVLILLAAFGVIRLETRALDPDTG